MCHPRFLARLLVSSSLIVSLPFACETFAADIAAAPSFASQTDTGGISSVPTKQPGGATTLEIAPQPADHPPARSEVPDARAFRKSEDLASRTRNSLRETSDRDHNPYLGISVEYSTHCYAGAEEHGFEVMNVYPGSPAARAGLQARTPSTPMGDLGALGSLLTFPVSLILAPSLRRSGALGEFGDLIVAVDDQRVRSKGELLTALGHLKPGDTTYFTVIRPIPGGSHKTMRIALHIDREVDALGNPYPDKACKANPHHCRPAPDPMLRKPFEAPANDGTHSPDTESAAN
jgi:S1-C subfamily serine protease